MKKKPHILIFNPDQMRADALHHLGNPAAVTPVLDQFARSEAVSFRNAFCQNPVCTPSRCSFLTGLYPHVHGHRTISHMLHDDQSSLFMELKNAGYYVWMNSRNDFLPAQKEGVFEKHADEVFYGNSKITRLGTENPNPRGEPGSDTFYSFFQGRLKVDEEGKHYSRDDATVEGAIDRIRNRPDDKPLCLFLGLLYPHPPYHVEEPYYSAIDRSALPKRIKVEDWSLRPSIEKALFEKFGMQGWTEDRWNELRACYLAMCMKVDEQFGKVCQALKEEGIYDDTAIFFFSDHGDYTGDYGIVEKTQNTFEDCLTNVPFLIKPPKGIDVDPGVSDSLTELVDFYATAIDFAGIQSDHTQFGKTLRPVLADRRAKHREHVFSEGGRLHEERHCTEEAEGGIGSDPGNMYYPRVSIQGSYGPEHTKATMIRGNRFKYVRRLYEQDELYDLQNDPRELENLINKPEYASVVQDMKFEMLDWYQATCDVVPFEADSRFNAKILFNNRFRSQIPIDKVDEIAAQVEQGMSLQELMNVMNSLKHQ